jgi:tRNA dimethylallyltransferase
VGADLIMAGASPESASLVLCLLGPTGAGKTDLALRLAEEFPIEIVSVDSAMVYRHMDVGTAKPDAALRRRVAHHLIDIRDPWEPYSAGQFRAEALRVIHQIQQRKCMPLLAGGTMLYFRALFRGLAPLPPADGSVRTSIEKEASERGWQALHADLRMVDPVAAARIGPLDRQRIQRALEVHRLTGQPISILQRRTDPATGLHFFRIALIPAVRHDLDRRLEARFAEMVRRGLVAEVERLMKLPHMSVERPAMRAVGYRQIWKYLAGEITLAEAQRQAVVATRRLAKRQLTWLRTETVDLALDALAFDTPQRVISAVESAGVSRLAERCNMMEQPLECREHGV